MGDRPGIPDDVSGLLGPSDLLGRLDRWLAIARADDAAAARSRERWLRQVAAESATFVGVLVDFAERSSAVAVRSVGGRWITGTVAGVGTDFVVLRATSGSDVLVAFAAIAAVRHEVSPAATLGDRVVQLHLGLPEAIAALAEDRPRVLVATYADPEGMAGELRAVGSDVLTLRLDGAGLTASVPIASVALLQLA